MKTTVLAVTRICALVGVCFLAACSCEDSKGTPCTSVADCAAGYACELGTCVPATDGAACTDLDGDGYGEGCLNGADCDDTSVQRGGPELCGDDVDNDCDNQTDEIAPLCAELCESGCQELYGPGYTQAWDPQVTNSSGVEVSPDGALTLRALKNTEYFLWTANTDEGTVSKLNSKTGAEIARYPSVLDPGTVTGDPDAWPPYGEECVPEWQPEPWSGNCPSRTSVDQAFNAYVANRAFGGQGTVTKFIGDLTKCDENANGVPGLQTSHDINGGGISLTYEDPETLEREFYSGVDGVPADDCVAWTQPVGSIHGVPRAVTVGLAATGADDFGVKVGDLWVGLNKEHTAVRLSSATGDIVQVNGSDVVVDLQGAYPYGAVADSENRIWFLDRRPAGQETSGLDLVYVDALTNTFHAAARPPVSCEAAPYGITVDGSGVVHLTYECRDNDDEIIVSYDILKPEAERWAVHTLVDDNNENYPGRIRGLAADDQFMWVSESHSGGGGDNHGAPARSVYQLDLASFNIITRFDDIGCERPVGMGVSLDESRDVWAICNGGGAAHYDRVANTWTVHPIGVGPYTYSDFMGYLLLVNAESSGSYAFVMSGCTARPTQWLGLRFPTSVIPDAQSLAVRVISAAAAEEINVSDTSSWLGPFAVDPVTHEATFPTGQISDNPYLGVELLLTKSEDGSVPKIFAVDAVVQCQTSSTL